MNSFLQDNKIEQNQLRQVLSNLLQSPVEHIELVKGGANSQVYKVQCASKETFACKHYFHHALDRRDRLGVEFKSIELMRAGGIRCVPEPVIMNREHLLAVYRFVDGERVIMKSINQGHLKQLKTFVQKLKDLSGKVEPAECPAASESCFSIEAIFESLNGRWSRLVQIENLQERHPDLHEYLHKDFASFVSELKKWSQTRCEENNIAFDQELPHSQRVLSPSDLGFHNALSFEAGEITFLDFEYFGWDDPAKLISDFILHPAMSLGAGVKAQFVQDMMDVFDDLRDLRVRVEIVYPLFGLKWCLIFLNEFISADLQRRNFAGRISNLKVMQAQQLQKAEDLLDFLKGNYGQFPYAIS